MFAVEYHTALGKSKTLLKIEVGRADKDSMVDVVEVSNLVPTGGRKNTNNSKSVIENMCETRQSKGTRSKFSQGNRAGIL